MALVRNLYGNYHCNRTAIFLGWGEMPLPYCPFGISIRFLVNAVDDLSTADIASVAHNSLETDFAGLVIAVRVASFNGR